MTALPHIYELVDVTNDETYWTLGLYSSEETARSAIAACDGMDGRKVNSEDTAEVWADEPERLEIRRRPVDIGSYADADVVARFERSWTWSDDEMNEVWSTREVRA